MIYYEKSFGSYFNPSILVVPEDAEVTLLVLFYRGHKKLFSMEVSLKKTGLRKSQQTGEYQSRFLNKIDSKTIDVNYESLKKSLYKYYRSYPQHSIGYQSKLQQNS